MELSLAYCIHFPKTMKKNKAMVPFNMISHYKKK